ncbi:hypothetical protein [Glycomyces terrestris]|uniref:DUF4397 domain-containing protein n=1 Tax=Glycomyces terrestris TaxID=2493553 RepID=A0A426V4M9_9ACTN|nr:hypothetical protein [Glycomyces terrestris]RRS01854.1 hypothetical protein EIW28_03670 [Glycomyces terrestris]
MLRRRTMAAALAAAALTGAMAAPAAAESDPPATAAPPPGTGSVVLPTGDRVHVLPGGALGLAPAAGREGVAFTTVRAADGDGLIVIPGDRADEILSGAEDARRYNVTDLVADGRTDAAALAAADLRAYAELPPIAAAADPTLTVTVRDHAGAVPDSGFATWYDSDDPEHSGTLEFDAAGVAAADLPPGDYLLTHAVWNLGPGDAFTEYVFGVSHVTVDADGAEFVLDGTAASPVTAETPATTATTSRATSALRCAPSSTRRSLRTA